MRTTCINCGKPKEEDNKFLCDSCILSIPASLRNTVSQAEEIMETIEQEEDND
jgi:hypothetical protein